MTDTDHFDALYAESDDPWGYDDRWYEKRKRSITLASLPRLSYRRAFEPGCSIGALTEQLAERCDSLLAADAALAAVEMARRRTEHLESVVIERRMVPREWPNGRFDLIVLSELGYYLDRDHLAELLARCDDSAIAGTHLVAVHWLGAASDFALDGGGVEAHDVIRRHAGWRRVVSHRDESFLLDVLERG